MNKLFSLMKALYYYLESSYKIRKVKQLQEDDLVYITRTGTRFEVYPGRKKTIAL